jgi:membrane associated rhomboid family serine protease
MGIYDREYYRRGPHVRFVNPLGDDWRVSATFWIIAINVGVFFLQLILREIPLDGRRGADTLLYCYPNRVVEGLQVWRLLTAAFCHSPETGLGHLFWNMLFLFFLGPKVERRFERRELVCVHPWRGQS